MNSANSSKQYQEKNYRGCSFKGQDLSGADFSNADIRSADFTGANLTGANFSNAKTGLSGRWVIPMFLFGAVLSALSGGGAVLATYFPVDLITEPSVSAVIGIPLFLVFTFVNFLLVGLKQKTSKIML